MAIASLVIGLVTILVGLRLFWGMSGIPLLSFFGAGNIFSVFLNIVGLVLGILAVRRRTKRGVAITGIILNTLGICYLIAIITMWGILGD